MAGFFKSSTLSVAPTNRSSLVAACGACKLFKSCQSPKMKVYGKGGKKILIVFDHPFDEEDESGKLYQSDPMSNVSEELSSMGIDVKKDCWTTFALICRPPDSISEDKRGQFLNYCNPNLTNFVKSHDINLILPIGKLAIRAVSRMTWKVNDSGKMSPYRFVGYDIPYRRENYWIVANWDTRDLTPNHSIHQRLWSQRLRRAVKLAPSKPHAEKTGKDWLESKVEVILDEDAAVKAIEWFCKQPISAADYETTALKPDKPKSKILCMSISTGLQGRTIAYLWTPKTAEATKKYWRSRGGKVASNLKMEDRWTWSKLRVRVRNWIWDTMIGSHTLDNREGVTSIKFLAFVNHGVESHDEHLSKYLKSGSGDDADDQNLAREEIDVRQLLVYCGMDALLEMMEAEVQMLRMRRNAKKHRKAVLEGGVL